MIALPVLFAGAVGAVVGLLGGGGSILLLPVLVYGADLPAREAVALSLLVIAGTSAAALIPHARAGHVQTRVGLALGAGGMLGAAVGAQLSPFVPERWLLAGFAVLMLATALSMRRPSDLTATGRRYAVPVSVIGLGVGAVSGIFGAGGGFLVVPALVLFKELSMRDAIGTSLLVIALQSSVGFASHLQSAAPPIDLAVALLVAATLGGAAAAQLSTRVPQQKLRAAFSWLVFAAGCALLIHALPLDHAARLLRAVPVSALSGGALIGLAAAALWLLHGRTAGISGIAAGLFHAVPGDRAWRVSFVFGLLAGGAAMHRALPGAFAPTPVSLGAAMIAGVLVGVGATLANGCTSGHGVCGVSRFSRRSMAATVTFMSAGGGAVYVAHQLVGVAR